MTICIAALADDSKAIVCVADKMLTFGDYLQWDADVTKIIPVPNSRSLCLIAGNVSQCATVLLKLSGMDDIGKNVSDSCCQLRDAYTETFALFQETTVLRRSGITVSTYQELVLAPQLNSFAEKITQEMHDFIEREWSCELTLCGFDENGSAFIIGATAPGNVVIHTTGGLNAIGVAPDFPSVKLLHSSHDRKNPIGRALYDVFDAKVAAEPQASVGFHWDASILFSDGRGDVPAPVINLYDRAWDHHNLSPFEPWNPIDNMEPPPPDWKERILNLSRSDLEMTLFS